MNERPTLTTAEVAARLQVRPATVRQWIRSGTLKAAKLGGNRAGWRVPVSEVERLERGR